jgi:hypothetical protein
LGWSQIILPDIKVQALLGQVLGSAHESRSERFTGFAAPPRSTDHYQGFIGQWNTGR